jgi:predicted dehydrogenase/nucleoside-diphosphate-sugar epimerase
MSYRRGERNSYRIGIVGTGYIANIHAEVLKELKVGQISACCDLNSVRAGDFQTKWGIANAYNDFDRMVSERDLDVIHVLVPPNLHSPLARKALEARINVFLEKPMAVNSAECWELVRLAEKNGVTIGVNHNAKFHPLFLRLKADLKKGRIGKLNHLVYYQAGPLGQLDMGMFSHWMFKEPMNIILEQAPHPLSQIRDLLGEILEIHSTASGLRELGKDQFFYNRWHAVARCQNGDAMIHLSFGAQYYPQSWIYASGQDGAIRADLLQNLYLVQEKSLFPDYLVPLANGTKYAYGIIGGIRNFSNYCLSKVKMISRADSFYVSIRDSIKAFYEAIADKKEPPATGKDGAAVVRICEMWVESAKLRENPKATQITKLSKKLQPEILVTGATGFIGKNLVEKLITQGKSVRVFVRSTQGLSEVFHSPLVEVFQGDITDPDQVGESVKGIQYIYHLAHGGGQNWKAFERANIEATRYVAEAAIKEGAKYFIYTSTIAVYYYGDIPDGRKVDETMSIDSEPEKRNYYARSKILAENMLRRIAEADHLPLVMFRPALVVGRGGRPYHDGVGLWTRDNVCAYWGMGKNNLPFVLVDDVVDALVRVLQRDDLQGEIFNLVGDVRPNAREYLGVLRDHSGRNIKSFPYPIWLLFISDSFKYMIKLAIGEHKNALLSYRDLINRAIIADFDCSKAKNTLGWRPCEVREEFIRNAISWAFEKAEPCFIDHTDASDPILAVGGEQ